MGRCFLLDAGIFQAVSEKKEVSGRVYLLESIGSFVAGIAFVFYLIEHLSSIEIVFFIISINLFSVIFYLTASERLKAIKNIAVGLLLLMILSPFISVAVWINNWSSRLLWYEYSLLETRNSLYSNIAITKERDQYTFFANGSPYATAPAPETSIEEFAHFSALFHERPASVLVIGGGAGGLLRELLKHPVENIDYTEQDPLIIEGFRRFSTPLTEYELNHEDVDIHLIEGRLFLKKTASTYDLILINLPIPSTLQINRYYTKDFFEIVNRHLKDGGIFALRIPGSETFLSEELKALNRTIHASLKSVFPYVRVIAGEQNIFLASSDMAIKNVTDDILLERLNSRNIKADLVNEWYLRYKMDSRRFGELQRDIESSEGKKINQDSYPRAVFESMLFLNLIVSPFVVNILDFIDKIPLAYYIVAVAALILVFLYLQHKKRIPLFLPFVITSTGFVSMLISILLILYFQIFYGYVYHYIGILTAIFMLGSAFGAFTAMKRINISLIKVEAAILSLTFFLYLFARMSPDTGSNAIIFGSMAVTGFLTGMEYPLSVNLADRSYTSLSSTAGRFYTLDLFGAFFGSILAAVIFIPTIGIINTLIIIIILKSGSLIIAYSGEHLLQKK